MPLSMFDLIKLTCQLTFRAMTLLMLTASIAVFFAACTKSAPTRLDEPTIRRFVQTGAQAAVRHDADALCAQLSEDAEVRLVQIRFSSSDVERYNKPQWCDFVRRTYAAVPQGVSIQTSVALTSIEIVDDGKSADITMDVHDSVSVGGHELRQTSQQDATVSLIEGRPRYTRLTARLAARR
jgi:hypothetical protein